MKQQRNHNDLAVLVIDMQETFLRRVDEVERLVAAQQEVLRYAAEQDVPVAILELKFTSQNRGTIDPIAAEVKKVSKYRYLTKVCDSGFRSPKLEEQLRAWKCRTLLLMGVYGAACVYATAIDGLEKGFIVLTDKELIRDINETSREIALARYNKKGCLLTDYRQFLEFSTQP